MAGQYKIKFDDLDEAAGASLSGAPRRKITPDDVDSADLAEIPAIVEALSESSSIRERRLIPALALRLAKAGVDLASVKVKLESKRSDTGKATVNKSRRLPELVRAYDEDAYEELVKMGAVPWAMWALRHEFEKLAGWRDGVGLAPEARAGRAAALAVFEGRYDFGQPPRELAAWAKIMGCKELVASGIEAAVPAMRAQLLDPTVKFAPAQSKAVKALFKSWLGKERSEELHGELTQEFFDAAELSKRSEPWLRACFGAMELDSTDVLMHVVAKMSEVEPKALSAWVAVGSGNWRKARERRGLVSQAISVQAYGCAKALLAAKAPTLAKLGSDGEWVPESNPFVPLRALVVKEAKRRVGDVGPEEVFDELSRRLRDELLAIGKDPVQAKELVGKAAAMGSKRLGAASSKSAWERLLLRQAMALSDGSSKEPEAPKRAAPRL